MYQIMFIYGYLPAFIYSRFYIFEVVHELDSPWWRHFPAKRWFCRLFKIVSRWVSSLRRWCSIVLCLPWRCSIVAWSVNAFPTEADAFSSWCIGLSLQLMSKPGTIIIFPINFSLKGNFQSIVFFLSLLNVLSLKLWI